MDAAVTEPSIMMKEEKAKQIVGKPAPESKDEASGENTAPEPQEA
jgi:hypothetical protein